MNKTSRQIEVALFTIILVAGSVLRLAALGDAPPGFSPQEMAHVGDALSILEGNGLPIVFTGEDALGRLVIREPLYAFITAPVMLIKGHTPLAARLTSALLGILLLTLVYLWVRIATQNRWLALATMAGLAISFWGVSTSRLALRAEVFPVFFMAAALLMRRGIHVEEDIEDDFVPQRYRPQAEVEAWRWFVLAGIALGLTFYTYPIAQIMWLVFPAFFIFLSLSQPGVIRRAWPGLALMLAIAGLVATPLFVTLSSHNQGVISLLLSNLLDMVTASDVDTLRGALRPALGILTVRGDPTWQYNIPGRPLLGPVISLLFYFGVSIAIVSLIVPYRPARRGRRAYDETFRVTSSNAFMLLTLVAGLVPVVLNGTWHSMLTAVGIQPALYYFPALAVVWMADWARLQVGESGVRALWVSYVLLLIVIGALTIHRYFGVWADAPAVRGIYETPPAEVIESAEP